MTLRHAGSIELPEHRTPGGFDHAAVHRGRRRLYVAHTANAAVDVIDLTQDAYVGSIDGLPGVAGALASDDLDLVITSNRDADTVSVIDAGDHTVLATIAVGARPNGLALDAGRGVLLVAGVGEPFSLTIVDVVHGTRIASIPAPGRTRWAVYDPDGDAFFVNIADPPSIVVVDAGEPTAISMSIPVDVPGPHGLDVDSKGRLYCACDGGALVIIEPPSYGVRKHLPLAGKPDVIFLDEGRARLYVAIGDPGLIQVFDVAHGSHVHTIDTEPGAHTIALDPDRHRIHAFLPMTHRAAAFEDGPDPAAAAGFWRDLPAW